MDVLTRMAAIARPLRRALQVLCAIALAAVFLLVGPVPQPVAYHALADQRTMLGIAYFWNVVSNLPILLVGLAGLAAVLVGRRRGDDAQSWLEAALWALFFTAVNLTALGSTYYHLAPDSPRLF